ncbi:probable phosphoglycerate mutase [Hathewaya proteolytica DSM 3090]|uniref:Probable phosphoglycerate mutase n=1 Tax=Hathewaya proteolytica DSM 3090 TaxID=1121331 RepID=A0A1M6RI21_9CLOT|nr:histidine phosphatase family protein [Hathewaya proteolytica]SHK32056.1 probable phosphoglycerate mutase [Hathewaya proteolytica DSM 3090]
MNIYLVRHGKDDETVRGGWSKASLTEEGVMQVKKLAEYISSHNKELNIKKIYSSDLERASETAGFIAAALNLSVEKAPQFRENNNGELAGIKNDIAKDKYPGLYWNTLLWEQCYPGGESPKLFFHRISNAWTEFTAKSIKDNENVMLVTHGGVLEIIFSIINNIPYSNKEKIYSFHNACLIKLEYNEGKWSSEEIY